VNFLAALVAESTAQQPLSQTVHEDKHLVLPLFYTGHGMGFQSKLLSDKGFYEHLGPILSLLGFENHNNEIGPGGLSN
jgi:hypothetical protein